VGSENRPIFPPQIFIERGITSSTQRSTFLAYATDYRRTPQSSTCCLLVCFHAVFCCCPPSFLLGPNPLCTVPLMLFQKLGNRRRRRTRTAASLTGCWSKFDREQHSVEPAQPDDPSAARQRKKIFPLDKCTPSIAKLVQQIHNKSKYRPCTGLYYWFASAQL